MDELTAAAERLLDEAGAIRAAFPDAGAMRGLPVSPLPDGGPGWARASLGYLRDEALLVRAGQAGSLSVLDDEVACVRRLLAPATAVGATGR